LTKPALSSLFISIFLIQNGGSIRSTMNATTVLEMKIEC